MSACCCLSAAGLLAVSPSLFLMTPSVAWAGAIVLFAMALWRAKQAWQIGQYQRCLRATPRYSLNASQVPISQRFLFLGKGFQWTQTHTERLYAARDKRAEKYLKPPILKQWIQRKALEWEHHPFRGAFMRWITQDSVLNPFSPPLATGGDPVIHGVGIRAETNAMMPLSERVGHMVVVARTRHGKTRLAELLTTQDIHRKGNCVIVLDPKGDADYLKRIYVETQRAGRLLIIFHLGFPEKSARYNAIGSFSRITEVATRIANQLPSEGDASAFKEFAWQFINVIAVALVALGERPDFRKIRRHISDIDTLIVEYGRYWLAENGPEDWQDQLEILLEETQPKHLSRGEQGKDFEAVIMVRYLRELGDVDQVLEGLISAFRYDREYFQKITVAVKPFLEKLTTGAIADVLAPNINDARDNRPVLEWAQAIRNQAVVYVGLDALTDPEVASAVGASMFSDLTSLAGHIYKHGIYPPNPEPQAQSTGSPLENPDIIIHGDEFSDLIGPQFKTLINKSGGAGYQLNLYTQTWSDPIAELGSEAKAGQLAGNIGTMLIMGVKEVATCEMFTKQLPEVSISEIMAVSGVTDSGTDDNPAISFTSNNQDRISVSRVPMISPADIVALPKGQAFVLLKGSELWKIRIPMPSKADDEALPNQLESMLDHMRQSYTSVTDWPSYHGR
ncbi:type IV conjugative transfer system coupling protein TraD [uncultured Pseudoteredinibacter sp.]|uniref:type IV conjugative transfer system coupling protein TraD n=1 Tax=uncultured Pseudoteredinibacter sp. TaxID=1641701 RepID=UPI002636188A|nr:type IV conjugative transfer system coupling protein TraD [uncultured Pseudoteredinibacter sp.]